MIELVKEILVEVDGSQMKFGYEDSKHNLYTLREIEKSIDSMSYSRNIKSSEVRYTINGGELEERIPLSLSELIQFDLLGVDTSKLESYYLGALRMQYKLHPDDIGLRSTIQVQGRKFIVSNISIDHEPFAIGDSWNPLRSTFGGYTVTIEGSSI